MAASDSYNREMHMCEVRKRTHVTEHACDGRGGIYQLCGRKDEARQSLSRRVVCITDRMRGNGYQPSQQHSIVWPGRKGYAPISTEGPALTLSERLIHRHFKMRRYLEAARYDQNDHYRNCFHGIDHRLSLMGAA